MTSPVPLLRSLSFPCAYPLTSTEIAARTGREPFSRRATPIGRNEERAETRGRRQWRRERVDRPSRVPRPLSRSQPPPPLPWSSPLARKGPEPKAQHQNHDAEDHGVEAD